MRKVFAVLAIAATGLVSGTSASGQASPASPPTARSEAARPASDRVLGEVTAIDPTNKKFSVKSETGQMITVNVDDKTLYRRIPPGETNVEKAIVINFADVATGDRVLARGKLDADAIQTRLLLVVSRSELVRSQEQSRDEWQRRGISGTIVSLDPATKEIVVRMRTAAGNFPIRLVASGNNVQFKQYAPTSTRYGDAIAGSFEQLKVGDHLIARGDRSEDGSNFKPEEIVTGSFRMAGGIITAVNQSTGEVTIRNIQTRQLLTVVVNKDSKLRRLPAELLARMEQSMQNTAAPQVAAGGVTEIRVMTPSGPGIRRIRTPPPSGQPGQPNASATPAPTPSAPPGANVRMMRLPDGATPTLMPPPTSGNIDYQEEIEKLPPLTIADLKAGDGIIVSSTGSGGDPSRATAITLAAGVDAFLKRQEEARSARPGYELDLALPGLGAP